VELRGLPRLDETGLDSSRHSEILADLLSKGQMLASKIKAMQIAKKLLTNMPKLGRVNRCDTATSGLKLWQA
jgi:hypothetical protein